MSRRQMIRASRARASGQESDRGRPLALGRRGRDRAGRKMRSSVAVAWGVGIGGPSVVGSIVNGARAGVATLAVGCPENLK